MNKLCHSLLSMISLAMVMLLVGCRGTTSDRPPIHPVLNMDFQSRFESQEENTFFADKRAMRPRIAGTVARGYLKEDDHFYRGKVGERFAKTLPDQVILDRALLRRGQSRFNIYCSACHGRAGFGDGIVIDRGMVPPTSFHDKRLRNESVGYFFHVITEGIRNMSSYQSRIPDEKDRWAIAAYVRALQLAQSGQVKDVPEQLAIEKGWK